jgi:hypothetical protein
VPRWSLIAPTLMDGDRLAPAYFSLQSKRLMATRAIPEAEHCLLSIRQSVANLCDIEKGRKGVSPGKAEQIAQAIGVPPALLVRLSIEASLRAGLNYKVEVKPAARARWGCTRSACAENSG